jgi:hypothetical protein
MTCPLIPLPPLSELSDFSRASGHWLATLGFGLAVGLPISAVADPLQAEAAPQPAYFRWLGPNAERPPEWLGESVYYRKGAGLEYRHAMKIGESPIVVGLQGPLLRKKKDPSGFSGPERQQYMSGAGLAVEVRF